MIFRKPKLSKYVQTMYLKKDIHVFYQTFSLFIYFICHYLDYIVTMSSGGDSRIFQKGGGGGFCKRMGGRLFLSDHQNI